MEAIDRWDPARATLTAYAYPYIEGFILRYLSIQRRVRNTSYLDEPLTEDGPTLLDVIPSTDPDTETLYATCEACATLASAMETLSRHERVIVQAFADGDSYRAAGRRMRLTRGKSHLRFKSGMSKLRKMPELKDAMEAL
jgi:DNA-directed RNA polymerase specialized sigma24 family protein